MRILTFILVTFLAGGCKSDFHASGPKRGVDAGVGIGPAPVYYLPAPSTVPPSTTEPPRVP